METLKLWLSSLFTPSVDDTLRVFNKTVTKLKRRFEMNSQLIHQNDNYQKMLTEDTERLVLEQGRIGDTVQALKPFTGDVE